jgi:hypothetical protein
MKDERQICGNCVQAMYNDGILTYRCLKKNKIVNGTDKKCELFKADYREMVSNDK